MKVRLFYYSLFPRNRKARHHRFLYHRQRDAALAAEWMGLFKAGTKEHSMLRAFITKPGRRSIDKLFAGCRGANPQIAAYYWGELRTELPAEEVKSLRQSRRRNQPPAN
jgi:hypothetical protein